MDAKQFKVTLVGNGSGGYDVTATPSDRDVIRLACSFYRSPTAASKVGCKAGGGEGGLYFLWLLEIHQHKVTFGFFLLIGV